jgi:PAS domain S-box-containing protein
MLNPILNLSPENVSRHLDILSNLINSGIYNHLVYQNLRNTNDEYQDILEHSRDMAIVAYPDGIIRECNQSLAELIGIEGNGRGLQLLDQIEEADGDSFKICWNKLLKGIEIKDQEVLIMDSNNRVIEAEISGNARRLPDNRIAAIRIYLRDMTERRESECKRSQLEVEVEISRQRQLAQVGLYVSGIAHNLQNPVQVLLGYIDVTKVKAGNPPWLGIIEDSAVKIKDIIKNLLNKMRREGSSEKTEININEMLDSELTFLNANPYFKDEITKHTSFGENIPSIKGIYADFTQALMNMSIMR